MIWTGFKTWLVYTRWFLVDFRFAMADTGAFTARVVLLLIIPFLHKTANAEEHCRAVNSIANRALEGHVIGVSTSSSVEKCHIKCEDEPKCYSFNYIFSSQSCELSKATRLSHPKQFLPRENVVYFESLHRRYHACVHPPCKNGGTCIILSQSPGYQCKCHLSYIGKDCQGMKTIVSINNYLPWSTHRQIVLLYFLRFQSISK